MFRGGRLLVAVVFVLALSVTSAHAAVRTVGSTKSFDMSVTADGDTCRVFTRATGFQLKSSVQPEFSKISRVPADGTMIAWTLALPKVSTKCTTGLNEFYFGGSSARVAVLRRSPKKGQTYYRYKLVAQSPKVMLRTYFGSHPSFALDKPLAVKRNDIIAITTSTWLPAFSAYAQDAGSTFRVSRPGNKCNFTEDDNWANARAARMHKKLGEIRRYGCSYSNARLMYNATIVDTAKQTKGYK